MITGFGQQTVGHEVDMGSREREREQSTWREPVLESCAERDGETVSRGLSREKEPSLKLVRNQEVDCTGRRWKPWLVI